MATFSFRCLLALRVERDGVGCCKSVAGLGEQGLSGGVNMGAGPERVFKVMRLNKGMKEIILGQLIIYW